jgi:nucleoid-associated protein YgaU
MADLALQSQTIRGAEFDPFDRPLRLTRRGRLALIVLCVAIIAIAAVAMANPVVADAPGVKPTSATVVVLPGDTLWDIARRVAPADDPRRTVYEIRQLNGLAGSEIRPGDDLVVPLR